MSKFTVRDIAFIALVAALYVVLTITPPLNALSYGPLQFRLSEMLNVLIFFHRRNVIAVTLGVVIADIFNPLIPVFDPIVGGLQTLIVLSLAVWLFSRYKERKFLGGLLNLAQLFLAFVFAFFMFMIAGEFVFTGLAQDVVPKGLSHAFPAMWLYLAVSEFIVIILGALIFNLISKRIDLTK